MSVDKLQVFDFGPGLLIRELDEVEDTVVKTEESIIEEDVAAVDSGPNSSEAEAALTAENEADTATSVVLDPANEVASQNSQGDVSNEQISVPLTARRRANANALRQGEAAASSRRGPYRKRDSVAGGAAAVGRGRTANTARQRRCSASDDFTTMGGATEAQPSSSDDVIVVSKESGVGGAGGATKKQRTALLPAAETTAASTMATCDNSSASRGLAAVDVTGTGDDDLSTLCCWLCADELSYSTAVSAPDMSDVDADHGHMDHVDDGADSDRLRRRDRRRDLLLRHVLGHMTDWFCVHTAAAPSAAATASASTATGSSNRETVTNAANTAAVTLQEPTDQPSGGSAKWTVGRWASLLRQNDFTARSAASREPKVGGAAQTKSIAAVPLAASSRSLLADGGRRRPLQSDPGSELAGRTGGHATIATADIPWRASDGSVTAGRILGWLAHELCNNEHADFQMRPADRGDALMSPSSAATVLRNSGCVGRELLSAAHLTRHLAAWRHPHVLECVAALLLSASSSSPTIVVLWHQFLSVRARHSLIERRVLLLAQSILSGYTLEVKAESTFPLSLLCWRAFALKDAWVHYEDDSLAAGFGSSAFATDVPHSDVSSSSPVPVAAELAETPVPEALDGYETLSDSDGEFNGDGETEESSYIDGAPQSLLQTSSQSTVRSDRPGAFTTTTAGNVAGDDDVRHGENGIPAEQDEEVPLPRPAPAAAAAAAATSAAGLMFNRRDYFDEHLRLKVTRLVDALVHSLVRGQNEVPEPVLIRIWQICRAQLMNIIRPADSLALIRDLVAGYPFLAFLCDLTTGEVVMEEKQGELVYRA